MDSGVLFLNSREQDRASRKIVDKRGEGPSLLTVLRRLPTYISSHGRVPLEFVFR